MLDQFSANHEKERASRGVLKEERERRGHPVKNSSSKPNSTEARLVQKTLSLFLHKTLMPFKNSVPSLDVTECAVDFASYKKFMAYGANTLAYR